MKDLGLAYKILGIQIYWDKKRHQGLTFSKRITY